MKKMMFVVPFAILLLSLNSFACKLSPVGSDSLKISAVANFISAQSANKQLRIAEITNSSSGFTVQTVDQTGNLNLSFYTTVVAPDCSVVVSQVSDLKKL